jgi:hypothetical protein
MEIIEPSPESATDATDIEAFLGLFAAGFAEFSFGRSRIMTLKTLSSASSRALGRLRPKTFMSLGYIDNETGMRRTSDRFKVVLRNHVESNLTPLDGSHCRSDFDCHAEQRRCGMPHCDLDADRVFPDVCVLEQEIAAGVLNVAYQLRRAVDATLLAHETNGTFVVDDDSSELRNSRAKALFHHLSPTKTELILSHSRNPTT